MVQRNTRQRTEIIDLLDDLDEFRSAQQLHEILRQRGSTVGLATVYRAVQTLSERGDVDVLRTADGESVYRRCGTRRHHHHLVCRRCGSTVEVDGPGAEEWASSVGRAHGFTDITHTIELFGICADCRGKDARIGVPEGGRGASREPVVRSGPGRLPHQE